MAALHLFVLFLAFIPSPFRSETTEGYEELEQRARDLLDQLQVENQRKCRGSSLVEWEYASNVTDETLARVLEFRLAYAEFEKRRRMKVNEIDWHRLNNSDMRRQFKKMSLLGTAALSPDKLKQFNQVQSGMERVYSTAEICLSNGKCELSLEPELTEIMARNRDEAILREVWMSWRKNTGKLMRQNYTEYVKLLNEAARIEGFRNAAEMWLNPYETTDFPAQVAKLWKQLTPLYEQLHAYVRGKLRIAYSEAGIEPDGPIPAHLLGNMWAQTWSNVKDLCIPFKNISEVNVTTQLLQQNYTANRMFRLADEFFTSLGLIPMTAQFWNNSILEKPSDGRELICHASAWDFCDGSDVRIKQCTRINVEDLITAHHEMGHIEYYLQYRDQPNIFHRGANPGFHEAVGDTLALSASTPEHLKKVGLLDKVEDNPQADINHMMTTALEKIAFLPFGYLIDRWRWDLFSGKTSEENMNCAWWKLRRDIQGLKPPSVRSEADFDPGSKFHIPAHVPYVRYFVSFVIQFQFHKALCIEAGQYDPNDPSLPLHKCDIYQSKAAGKKLADMLKLGSSKPWPVAMQAITGQREMDASALLEYFQPLYVWLQNENKRTNQTVGWKKGDIVCTADTSGASTKTGSNPAAIISIIMTFVTLFRH